jgi:5'-methylthioadenosine phosphorylase
VVEAWEPGGPALRDGGVYWQTIGPRFETPAEIRLIAANADVVGMTIASECVVAKELGLSYAAICVVDNLANGIGARALSVEEMEAHRDANAERLREGLSATLPRLGAVGR